MTSKQIPVQVNALLREKLTAAAEEQQVSLAEIIRRALHHYFEPTQVGNFSDQLFTTLKDPVHWQTFCAIVQEMTGPDGRLPATAPPAPQRGPAWRYQPPEGATPRRPVVDDSAPAVDPFA